MASSRPRWISKSQMKQEVKFDGPSGAVKYTEPEEYGESKPRKKKRKGRKKKQEGDGGR